MLLLLAVPHLAFAADAAVAERLEKLERLVASQSARILQLEASLEHNQRHWPDGQRRLQQVSADATAATMKLGSSILSSDASDTLAVRSESVKIASMSAVTLSANNTELGLNARGLKLSTDPASEEHSEIELTAGGLVIRTQPSAAAHAEFKLGGHSFTMTGVNDPAAYVHRLPYIEWRTAADERAMYLGWGETDDGGGANQPKHVDMALENGYMLKISGGHVSIGVSAPTEPLAVKGAVETVGYAAKTIQFTTFFSSGTTHTLATLGGPTDSGTTAIATIEYTGLYSYAGATKCVGVKSASTRRVNSNSGWGSNAVDVALNGDAIHPQFAWDADGQLKLTTGAHVQITGVVRITAHSATITRVHNSQ